MRYKEGKRRLSNTSVRVIVGLFGISLIIFLALGKLYFSGFLCFVALLCMNEFYNLFEKPKSTRSFNIMDRRISFHKTVF
jgi:hypothetical protein